MAEHLDLTDKKILYHLDCDSRAPASAIAKKVHASGVVVHNRIKKLIEKGIIRRFQTVVEVGRMGYFASKIYIKLQSTTESQLQHMVNELKAHARVFWIGICQGRWDFIIAFWSRTVSECSQFTEQFIDKYSDNILEREITISRDTLQFNRRWFYSPQTKPIIFRFNEANQTRTPDNTEMDVLRWLANNARMPTVQLAKHMNITSRIIMYRIVQLRKEHIISGYKIAINTNKMGYETCKSFIQLHHVTEESRRAFIEYCMQQPNIINIVTCIGPWDIELEMEVENFDVYYRIMEGIKSHFITLVRSYDSVVFKDEPKQDFMPGCHPQQQSF